MKTRNWNRTDFSYWEWFVLWLVDSLAYHIAAFWFFACLWTVGIVIFIQADALENVSDAVYGFGIFSWMLVISGHVAGTIIELVGKKKVDFDASDNLEVEGSLNQDWPNKTQHHKSDRAGGSEA